MPLADHAFVAHGSSVISPRHQQACESRMFANEMVCKPSSVPRLRAGTVIHLRRRLPDVFSGRPESEATPLPPDRSPTALLFGLAPGRACPFHPAQVACATLPARLCGASPRLSADGC